jgi:hypothetical protein
MALEMSEKTKPAQQMRRRKTVIYFRSAIIVFGLIGMPQLIYILIEGGDRVNAMLWLFIALLFVVRILHFFHL